MALSPSIWPLLYRTARTSFLCSFSSCFSQFLLTGREEALRGVFFSLSLTNGSWYDHSTELCASTISEAQRTKGTLLIRVSVFGTV